MNILRGQAAPVEVRRRLFVFLDAQKEARDAGRPWFAASASVHSRKYADALALEARERYGADLVKLYTSETDDYDKKRDFADPATAWADAAVVIYTGTVSVGVSAALDRITNAFGFFTSNNARSSPLR